MSDGRLYIPPPQNELDPIRRYMPSYNRPKQTARYSAFQVCRGVLRLNLNPWNIFKILYFKPELKKKLCNSDKV